MFILFTGSIMAEEKKEQESVYFEGPVFRDVMFPAKFHNLRFWEKSEEYDLNKDTDVLITAYARSGT